MKKKKQSRPSSSPIAVRFTTPMLEDIDLVANDLDMSRQDIIRLSVGAGLKALKNLGKDGLLERISKEI